MSISDKDIQESKEKKRKGTFKCEHEGCGKFFTRSEHLSRHKLNHNPSVIYHCPWDGCEKWFVRNDLKERHVKRHRVREERETYALNNTLQVGNLQTTPAQISNNSPINPTTNSPRTGPPNFEKIHNDFLATYNQHSTPKSSNGVSPVEYPPTSHLRSQPSSAHPKLPAQQRVRTSSMSTNRSLDDLNASPSNLLNWLFDDHHTLDFFELNQNSTSGSFFNPNADPFDRSSSLIDDTRMVPPKFPNPTEQTLITPSIIQILVNHIPIIAGHECLDHLGYFLELYWSCFHIQFPILHRPSFSTLTAPPILLLSMIITGASFSSCITNSPINFKENPRVFADLITVPLRYIIFQSKDFEPPSEVYVAQSLLLLECYERLSTNRMLHERAYLHHGTTIQLLRRRPGLGGNPMNNKTEYNSKEPGSIWEKWIKFETLKRTTMFAFYIDSTHSAIFGYPNILNPHQIQLSLPCDDDLWESYLSDDKIPKKTDSLPFLLGLKKLLNKEQIETSRFGKSILLCGLLSLNFQLEQRDIQGSILEFDKLRDTWKDSLSLALDFWNCNIMNGCCNTNSSIYNSHDTQFSKKSLLITPPTLREYDTRCKHPVYHMSQISLRVQQYDYHTYAGAPWRMNVEAETSDYALAEKKIKAWSITLEARISVIYGYLFLFEMFLSPEDSPQDFTYTNYDANNEAIYPRLSVLSYVSLLLWSYNYSLYGPESQILEDQDSKDVKLVPKEDAFDYLRRIRSGFSQFLGEPIHLTKPSKDGIKHNKVIRKLAHSALPRIKDTHHIAGLMMMMSNILKDSYWDIGSEFSNLIWNVCERSFGSKNVRCGNMYKRSYR